MATKYYRTGLTRGSGEDAQMISLAASGASRRQSVKAAQKDARSRGIDPKSLSKTTHVMTSEQFHQFNDSMQKAVDHLKKQHKD